MQTHFSDNLIISYKYYINYLKHLLCEYFIFDQKIYNAFMQGVYCFSIWQNILLNKVLNTLFEGTLI